MELLSSLPEFQEVPKPFLINALKHHISVLRGLIAGCVAEGAEGMPELARVITVLGNSLMDMYWGPLTLPEIYAIVQEHLEAEGAWEEERYRGWVAEAEGYRSLTLPDSSCWILYSTDVEGRYVHIHPGRHSPHTSRMRGKALKTAVLTVAHAGVEARDPFDVELVNLVRKEHLELSPIREIEDGGGLHVALSRLLGNPS